MASSLPPNFMRFLTNHPVVGKLDFFQKKAFQIEAFGEGEKNRMVRALSLLFDDSQSGP
jgi:hypothetical protein